MPPIRVLTAAILGSPCLGDTPNGYLAQLAVCVCMWDNDHWLLPLFRDMLDSKQTSLTPTGARFQRLCCAIKHHAPPISVHSNPLLEALDRVVTGH